MLDLVRNTETDPVAVPEAGSLELNDVLEARDVIKEFLRPTPTVNHPVLDERVGCEVHVKLENACALGSFKLRGGLNLLAGMSDEEKTRGLVTATRGNHGQSIAEAARLHGVTCTIFVPEGNNPHKNRAMAALGADVRTVGHDFDAASEAAMTFSHSTGARYVHAAEEPALVAGVGTLTVELLDQVDGTLDAVLYPVGGGSMAAGGAVAVKAMSPNTEVIGVQAENAPALYRSWLNGRHDPFPVTSTVADGLAVRKPPHYTMRIMRELVDHMITVTEEEIYEAIRCYAETIHQMAEGAGAVPLAGALKLGSRLAGKRIGVVLSGGNIDTASLMDALSRQRPEGYLDTRPGQFVQSMDYGF